MVVVVVRRAWLWVTVMHGETAKWVLQLGNIDAEVVVVVGDGTVVDVAEVVVAEVGMQVVPKAEVRPKFEACSRSHCHYRYHCCSQSE